MGLPVDSVDLRQVEANKFFETADPLYCVSYLGPALKQSTLDAIVEKFVPIDNGFFHVRQSISDEQMKKLFEKCVLSNKTVTIWAIPNDFTKIFDSRGPIDYSKYFSVKLILREGKLVRFGNKEKDKLELQVRLYELVEWSWSEPSRLIF
uniref:Thioredoxin_14 domain-containing protein n=1 Tax=Steinernema glaseri TaxID=37863 RepID=A0A1I8AU59_9BILA